MSARSRRVSGEIAALVQTQREQLFKAAAIVAVVKYASMSAIEGLSSETVVDALDAAYALIDGAASALEAVSVGAEE